MAAAKPKPIFISYVAKDFLDGTQILEPMEELAYRRICDLIYVNDGTLADDGGLAWATKTGEAWPEIRASLIAKKKIRILRGKVVVKRCRDELEKIETLRKVRKNASKKGVLARKKASRKPRPANTETVNVAKGLPTKGVTNGTTNRATKPATYGQPNQEPLTNSKSPLPPPESSPEPRAASLSDEVVAVVMNLLEAADPAWATRSGAVVRQWLADGADPEHHILPVIRQAIDRGQAGEIGTLNYFTAAIRRRIAERPVAASQPAEDAPRHHALAMAQDRGDDAFEIELSMALRDHGAEAADRLGKDYLERQHVSAPEA